MKAQRHQVLRVDAEAPHLVTATVHSTASLFLPVPAPRPGSGREAWALEAVR
ncbi:hypothetical protein [Comamonas sp. JC664]|uniref:hypothetical protein n=1 Tax=Comamonas sp. JC664 TaxID=2801917 RepID=UPI00174B88D5|nr:hypothetical protein [Comamonas sp. JC664]MBL0695191.1 hypothetical protein [Comamonas sp. JC664]